MLYRVRVLLQIIGLWLLYFWAARALFLGYHHERLAGISAADLAGGFGSGFRLDISAATYLSAIPAVLLVFSPLRILLPVVRWLIGVWTAAAVVAMSVLVAADLELFRQWDKRIDASVVWYLRTPAEAWASTGGTPRLLLAAVAIGLAGGAWWVFRRWAGRDLKRLEPIHPLFAAPLVLVVGVLVIPARGGIQTWPLTGSSAYRSAEPFVNQSAQNAAWGFFDSAYRRLYDRTNPFVALSPADAERVAARPVAAAAPGGLLTTPRPNVLVIIWESASARAFGSLGGQPGITPRTDSLARQGLLFRKFYAAGDRTDKGVAAILSGFPGLPRGSIMMVPSKTKALPFLNADFEAAGYRSSFYYGGELEFASLKAYLANARYQRVVGKGAFPPESWITKWGAHDAAVADRVLEDLGREAAPFFSVWLTSSSHEPFETSDPPRIPGSDWQSQYFNSLAYTDAVIGRFIDRARTNPWWSRTLVVIVADHGRRVVPLDNDAPLRDADAMFRIPMLWVGGALAVADTISDRIGSQTDLAPTLAAAAGLIPQRPYRYGTSLLGPNPSPFAYYGFDTGFGVVAPGGSLVYDHRAGRITSSRGAVTDHDLTLGRALSQLTYQDYLDR